jgi:hypothetical protein
MQELNKHPEPRTEQPYTNTNEYFAGGPHGARIFCVGGLALVPPNNDRHQVIFFVI